MKLKLLIAIYLILLPQLVHSYQFIGTISGETVGDQFGTTFCIIDFNADGHDDLAISAPANDEAGVSSGKVYIYYGGPAADLTPDITLTGPSSSFFGNALSSAGDFNHDGYEDLLVGAPFYDIPATSTGAAYLFYGGPTPDNVSDHEFVGEAGSDYFGNAVSSADDFNNDGYDDIAIAAYKADWGTFSNSGKVYIYFGGPSPDFAVDLTLVGEADGERFGFSLTGGDFNGDNVGDVAVGAYSYDSTNLNIGRIYLFSGGNPTDSLADLVFTGSQAGEKYGWCLTKGNLNNDPYDDIIMGSDGYLFNTSATGGVYLFLGGSAMDNMLDGFFALDRQADDYLGFSLHSGIDINDDGYDDILAGMPGNDDGGIDAGGFLLISGPETMVLDSQFLGELAGEELGSGVAFWPNYQQPGKIVMAGGAPDYDNFRGRVFFYAKEVSGTNEAPVVSDIPDQTVGEGANFTTINLDDYVTDPDNLDDEIDWMYAGNTELTVSIDINRIATITTPNIDWNGSETITFTATDPGLLAGSNPALFTVTAVNDPPIIEPAGDKTALVNTLFEFDLFAIDVDGSSLTLYSNNLPNGASFVDNGWNESEQRFVGTFSWTPSVGQIGVHPGIQFIASDSEAEDTIIVSITVIDFLCGDANGDGTSNVGDAVFLINFVFKGGPAPDPLEAGDANCDGGTDVGDAVYLINYVFKGGPGPCESCP